MLRLLCLLLLAAALLAAGCGGGDSDEAAATRTPAAQAAPTTKPEVDVPRQLPDELQITDLRKGTGKVARAGSTVTVHYVGVSALNGRQFDASWDKGEPFTFELGSGNVIQGWDQGVAGMRVGGRRRLVIPPDLAYGSTGQLPSSGPDETLVFVVDLLRVQ